MGGYGSGRPQTRLYAEQAKRLDLRWLRANGYLRPGSRTTVSWNLNGEPFGSISLTAKQTELRLSYRVRDYGEADWRDLDYPIALERSPCHFGGFRAWMACPRCSRRSEVLYMRSEQFYCRCCARVAYQSQGETRGARADRMFRKLDVLLDPDGIGGDEWTRPKGMRVRRFNELVKRANRYGALADESLSKRIAKLFGRFGW